MASHTRRMFEDLDNQHDFERMAADILNALGYSDVAPIAASGGPDGGVDVTFREGDTTGRALVTLDKRIKDKFALDLAKQDNSGGLIALFCTVDVTAANKLKFTQDALARGYRLLLFDLERLRSLLDSSLKDIRRRYLHIDDDASATIRLEVRRLLRFPEAVAEEAAARTLLETMLKERAPQRLFDLLLRYDERDVVEVPQVGQRLREHLTAYYGFRKAIVAFEDGLLTKIASIVGDRFNSQAVWRMYLRYALMRFFGMTKDDVIASGNFLNYGVTWDDTERQFLALAEDSTLAAERDQLTRDIASLNEAMTRLRTDIN